MVSTTQRRTTPRLSASGAVAVATTPTNRSARRPSPPPPRVSLLEREGHDARRCRYCCRLAPHFFLSKKEERERERERVRCSLFFFTFLCGKKMGKNKWEKMVEKMDLFLLQILSFLLFNEKGGGEGGPPPFKTTKIFMHSSLLSPRFFNIATE